LTDAPVTGTLNLMDRRRETTRIKRVQAPAPATLAAVALSLLALLLIVVAIIPR